MAYTVSTSVVMLTQKEVSDEDADEVVEDRGAENLEEAAASMEEAVEAIMMRQFSDADSVPILDVTTYVAEEDEEVDPEELVE